MALLIPAICNQCGFTSFSPGIHVEGNVRITMVNTSISCPRCGGLAKFVDGIYEGLGDAQRITATSKESARQLERLLGILKDAQQNRSTSKEIQQAISTNAPEYSSLAALFLTKESLRAIRDLGNGYCLAHLHSGTPEFTAIATESTNDYQSVCNRHCPATLSAADEIIGTDPTAST